MDSASHCPSVACMLSMVDIGTSFSSPPPSAKSTSTTKYCHCESFHVYVRCLRARACVSSPQHSAGNWTKSLWFNCLISLIGSNKGRKITTSIKECQHHTIGVIISSQPSRPIIFRCFSVLKIVTNILRFTLVVNNRSNDAMVPRTSMATSC